MRSVAIVLVCILSMTGAFAASDGTYAGVDASLANTRDADSYARDFDVTREEAARRLLQQQLAGEFLEKAQLEQLPDFAGAWLQHSPTFRLVVQFKGDKGDYATFSAAPIEVEVRYRADRTLSELTAALPAISSEAQRSLNVAGAYVDVRTNDIVVEVQPSGLSDADLDLEAGRLSTVKGIPVRVHQLKAAAADDIMRGGKVVASCTTAFAIGTYSGTYGFLTSAHCGDLYNTTSCAMTYDYSGASCWRNHAYGASHDVQHRTVVGDSAAAEFWDGSTQRPVYNAYSWASQQAGWYACHYGWNTGYSCGTIATKYYQPTYGGACPGGPCNADWIQVTGGGLSCGGGDSGGPWFVAGSAYGVHKGSPGSSCIYMPIDRITAMSVFVLTQ